VKSERSDHSSDPLDALLAETLVARDRRRSLSAFAAPLGGNNPTPGGAVSGSRGYPSRRRPGFRRGSGDGWDADPKRSESATKCRIFGRLPRQRPPSQPRGFNREHPTSLAFLPSSLDSRAPSPMKHRAHKSNNLPTQSRNGTHGPALSNSASRHYFLGTGPLSPAKLPPHG
jgi:hypothetical protein